MTSFIDLRGASGAVYRFRLAQAGDLPATAGNFVCMAGEQVVCCGTSASLSNVATAWNDAVKRQHATSLYVRLNVARSVRAGEHDDLVSALRPPLVVSDLD